MEFKIITKSGIGVNNLSRSIVVVYNRIILPREFVTFFMMKKHYPQFKNKNNK